MKSCNVVQPPTEDLMSEQPIDKDRKPYTPPTITEHGDVVKQTKGLGGKYWELPMPRSVSVLDMD
jgi:hypothetical protein